MTRRAGSYRSAVPIASGMDRQPAQLDSEGRPLERVPCWCGRTEVSVPLAAVERGESRTCGGPGCHWPHERGRGPLGHGPVDMLDAIACACCRERRGVDRCPCGRAACPVEAVNGRVCWRCRRTIERDVTACA